MRTAEFTSILFRARTGPVRVQARAGGGNGGIILPGGGGGNPGDRPSQKLIMPGGGGRGASSSRPSQPMNRTPGTGSLIEVPGAPAGAGTQAPATARFRPPTGFMEGNLEDEDLGLDPEVMLNILRTQGAPWHEMGRMIPALQGAGFDSKLVEELTGVPSLVQSRWLIAAEVFRTIVGSGEIPEPVIAYFENGGDSGQGGDEILFELRYVDAPRRVASALLCYERRLDARMANLLCRAMKDHERQREGYEAFSEAPGDCLAMRYWRDACEANDSKEKESFVEKGLSFAVTESARARVKSALSGAADGDGWAVGYVSEITFLRLEAEELGYRPVPVAGTLGSATGASVTAASSALLSGTFGVFRPTANEDWVALPTWTPLALSERPVGLLVEDCATVPSLLYTAAVKREQDARRLRAGPGLLIADRIDGKAVRNEGFYLVAPANGGAVEIVAGNLLGSRVSAVVGEVLFVCRPPALDMPATSFDQLGGMALADD